MNKLVIVDGNSLANRAFYALPFLTNSKVEPSGAVYGFANLLSKIIVDYKPEGIVVAFDHARKTFRNQIYSAYKGTRKPTPSELTSQFPVIKKMLEMMGIMVVEQEGIEADDIIGTIAKNSNCDKVILSGDRDLLQLISRDTEVWLTIKGVSEILKVKEDNLEEHFHISSPSQVIELKALMGDDSDNIPGVRGIGEKTAQKLLKEYGTIDEVYANIENIGGKVAEKLLADKTMAYISKELATIKTDCDIQFDLNKTKYSFPFTEVIFNFFNEWNFHSLTKRKELFEDSALLNKVDENLTRIKIDSIEKIKELKENIKSEFAYSLERMEFCANKDCVYFIEPEITMFNDTVALEDALAELKDIFENENILKITDSSKSDIHILNRLDIKPTNFYDVGLAGYVLYTGIASEKISLIPTNLFFSKKEFYNKNMEEFGVLELYYKCELPLVTVLASMEENGFKLDKVELDRIDVEFTNELEKITAEIHEDAGEVFNINSPKSVAYILFDKLGLKSYNNKKKSTGIEILTEIAWQHPVVEKIIKYRKYQKLKTTYIDVYKRLCENGGDIIHTQFNQTLTNTGRLSSSEPNLQNIPTRGEEGKVLRKIFISKFEGGQLVSADYNQIELRLLADMSMEESLVETYRNNGDIHTLTASQIFNVPIKDVTIAQRSSAKAVNFGIIYGISDYGLSQNLHISKANAKQYINSYFQRYPKVKKYNEDCVEFARKNGYIKSKFGRVRYIPEINSTNYNQRNFAERVAMNMPLQGTASDIIKFAMVEVFNKIQMLNLKSQLILQIHDELIVDVYPSELGIIKEILKETMENVVKLNIPLVVGLGIGNNLYECKD